MIKDKNLYDILRSVSSSTTISNIANKLFLSEPYISKVIKDAESKYHVILIKRNKKPISLTPAGSTLLKDLQKIVENRNELEYDLLPYQENSIYEIKVAFNQPWLETSDHNVIEYLMQQFPSIVFSFYEQTTNLAQNNLLNHTIDIFVGKVLVNKVIESTFISDSPLSFLIPKGNPLFELSADTLTPELFPKFDNIKFISLTSDSFFQAMIDHLFEENEISVNKVVKVANSQLADKLMLDSIGISIASSAYASQLTKKYSHCFKEIHIPTNMLQLSNGVSYLKGSPIMVRKIADKLIHFLQVNNYFEK